MAVKHNVHDGHANYTGTIESGAATSTEAPWHLSGKTVDPNQPIEKLLKAAGIDWTVSLRPIAFNTAGEPGTGFDASESLDTTQSFRALVRDSDSKLLDVVGSRFLPTQNADAFRFFNEFVEAGNAHIKHLGSLRAGRLVWGLADLGDQFVLPGKDTVANYLLLALPHEQGRSIQVKRTSLRFACMNMLTHALKGNAGFRQSHRLVFDTAAQEQAKKALGIAREDFDAHKEEVLKLAKAPISHEAAIVQLTKLLDPELFGEGSETILEKVASGDVSKKLGLCVDALTQSPGCNLKSAQGTLWGMVNAVTYAVDHTFGRGADQRLTKAWFGNGEALKNRAYRTAVELAG